MYLKKLPENTVKQLFHAIISLQTKEECMAFFDDLCTMNEINAFIQRLQVARMLRQGATYMDVQLETGASSTTITRVKKLLDYGNEGYSLVLDRIENPQKSKSQNTAPM
jgi:TrpR-related protein YerC/YecD